MHPLIKILSFIIFAIFVSLGTVSSVLAGFVLLLAVWLVTRSYPNKRCVNMLRRMKILFISMFIVYLWFTPGQLIYPVLNDWSPTYEGFYLALLKMLALAVLILAVTSLLRLTPRDQLVCGIYYVSYPITWFGLRRDRLIARTILTLELASQPAVRKEQSKQKLAFSQYMNALVNQFAENFKDAIEPQLLLQDLEVEILPPPSIRQWLMLLSLLIFVIVVLWV